MSLYPNNNKTTRSHCDNRVKKYKSQMPVCPSENNEINILKCDSNNNSRACPVLYCNYQKHAEENSKIFERNLSQDASRPIKSIRGGYTRCHQYIDLDSNNPDLYLNLKNKIPPGTLIKNKYIPGKGAGIEFLRHIDVDSDLRNLKIKKSNCPSKKFKPNMECQQNTVDNPQLLMKPYCQNYKHFKFNDSTPIYKTKCDQQVEVVNKILPQNEYADVNLPCSSRVNLNYTNCGYDVKRSGNNCLEFQNFQKCQNPTQWKAQPLLFSQHSDVPGHNNLYVGPVRSNHKCENLWNNVSKRQYINEP